MKIGENLDVAGKYLLRGINITDGGAGSNLGSASVTVDISSTFFVNQTTNLGASSRLWNQIPTDATAGSFANIINVGTQDLRLTISGSIYVVPINTILSLMWNGTRYVSLPNRSINGSVIEGIARVTTTNYTVLETDVTIHLATGFTGVVTLPSAVSSTGRVLTIVNYSGAIQTTSISFRASNLALTNILGTDISYQLQSGGTEWIKIN